MAHSTRQVVAPPRKRKPKRRQPEDEGVFEDVVALDIPRKVLAGPFRVDLPLDGVARRKPHVVYGPETTVRQALAPPRKGKGQGKKAKRIGPEEDGVFQDVVTLRIPRKRLFASFPGELRIDRARRRTPNPVVEPDAEED